MHSDLIDPHAAMAAHDALSSPQAEAIVRLVESAPQVRRRYQFFAWTQTHLQTLLPHPVAVCGAYQRQRRGLVFEALHNVVLRPPVLAVLTDADGPLLRTACAAWVDGRGRALALDLPSLRGDAREAGARLGDECGTQTLLVHGVARPQRPAELETMFLFACPPRHGAAPALRYLELLLPHLHVTWLRVLATESELPSAATPVRGRIEDRATPDDGPEGRPPHPASRAAGRPAVTDREREILGAVREGMSNHEIGARLGISPLTVKNHVQKILRKLGAANRAQAVALAMSLGLLGPSGG